MIQTYRWQLQVSDITEAWVRNQLKPIIVKYLKKWIRMPRSANSNLLFISKKGNGFGILDVIAVYKAAKLSQWYTLKNSKDSWIREVHQVKTRSATNSTWNEYKELENFEASINLETFRSVWSEKKRISKYIQKHHDKKLDEDLKNWCNKDHFWRVSARKTRRGRFIGWIKSLKYPRKR
jgi:hypothetical protein